MLLGAADMMPRNLDGRVGVLFPVRDPDRAAAIRDDVLRLDLDDDVRSRLLQSDGSYLRRVPKKSGGTHAQSIRLGRRGSWHLID